MGRIWLALTLGSALAGSAIPAFAGSYGDDSRVIPGYGSAAPTARIYQPGRGYVAMVPDAPPQAVAAPAQRRPRFGGGLLDAMLGDDRGPIEPQPAYRPRPLAYASRAPVAYNSAETQVDPYGNTVYAVQPGRAVDPKFQRQEVDFAGNRPVGSIVIDTTNKFLYLVEGGGRAMRYGIGVGRPGFVWTGTKTVTRKAEWPDWTPPSEMLLRRPDLPRHMEGGIANPLGARAMYLGDSLYRIHGTNEPETIGTNVSSGCIRLTNEDVSDLYTRVKVGTQVTVL